jgi:hypothetical protein
MICASAVCARAANVNNRGKLEIKVGDFKAGGFQFMYIFVLMSFEPKDLEWARIMARGGKILTPSLINCFILIACT